MLTLHKGDPPQLHLFQETVTWPAKVDINNTGENLVGEKKKNTQNTILRSLIIILTFIIISQFRLQWNICSLSLKITHFLYKGKKPVIRPKNVHLFIYMTHFKRLSPGLVMTQRLWAWQGLSPRKTGEWEGLRETHQA